MEKELNNKKKHKKKKEKKKWEIRDFINTANLIVLLTLVGCVYFFVAIIPHRVDGHSMAPTLADNDRLFVKKNAIPKRYSLIIFNPLNNSDMTYVKRVVGIPGDTIWFDNNTLYLNQTIENKGDRPEVNSYLAGKELPDSTLKIWVSEKIAKELYAFKEIPKNYYFVLGDNRNHSKDSRQLGLIQRNQIEGTVLGRYYPFSKMGLIE